MRNLLKRTYSKLRQNSPDSINGIMGRLVFNLGNKPFVRRDDLPLDEKFPNKEKGGLIISADFEMAWAWRYTKTGEDYIKKGQIERENFPFIIKILEEYNIPITFATVGHLFLDHCQKGDHDWMKRIPYFDDHWKYLNGDWYDHDPYSNYKDSPEWYASDLIQNILDSKVNHEIGCHTFSHIDFSDKNCPMDVADDEIKASKAAANYYNIALESMVFPGGSLGNVEVLKNHDFKIYRKNDIFDISYPYRDKYGLLISTRSGALEFNRNYGWSAEYFIKRLEKTIKKAIATNTIAHLWFHPSLDPFFLKNVFPVFFQFVSNERERGNLWIGPMKEIAMHINSKKLI